MISTEIDPDKMDFLLLVGSGIASKGISNLSFFRSDVSEDLNIKMPS